MSDQKNAKASFAVRLHNMLSDIDQIGAKHGPMKEVVSWLPDGQSFFIKDKQAFEEQVLPVWFFRLKFLSFERQLFQFGFVGSKKNDMYRVYCHKDFQRGESDLARQMVPKRKRVKPQGNQFALPDSNQVNHQQEISPANSFVSGAVEAANALTKLHPPHVIENLRLMLRPLAELEPSSPPETLCVGTTAHTSSPTTTIWTNEGTMPLASGAHHWDASLANAMFSDSTVQGFARHLTGVCDQKQCGLLENDSASLNLDELMNLPLNDDSLLSSSTRRCSMSFYDTSLDDFEPTLLW